jgi:hypothetical protein
MEKFKRYGVQRFFTAQMMKVRVVRKSKKRAAVVGGGVYAHLSWKLLESQRLHRAALTTAGKDGS